LLLTLLTGSLLAAGLSPTAGARVLSAVPTAAPPAGSISSNVDYVTTLPEMRTAISINFIGNTMFVSATDGLFSYDISDPAAPKLLGALPMYIWENEDMDVDVVHKRVFISRDPRGFTTSGTSGSTFPYGAVHIIDVSQPAAMVQVGFFTVPAGHTSTCVNACDYLWTGGPYANAQTQPGITGRPIFATDVRDPLNPVACPHPIDIGRNDGVTDYAHDVQVDANGVAWVSGAGGVRGYWTSGDHIDPLTGESATATGCEPIPYGGGGSPTSATPSRFMHNAWRNVDASIPDENDSATPGDETKGMVLYATEENITSNCNASGRFTTYDLRGSLDGEGWNDIATTKFRMRVLDTWTPQQQEGATACSSAHYFDDRGDGLLAYGFYGQGTRFLDVSDPKDIRQVGYFRPDGANTWGAYFYKGYVFIADNARGIDIVKFQGSAAASRTVAAPLLSQVPAARMDRTFSFMCSRPTRRLTTQ
jgi:hypothetical protein